MKEGEFQAPGDFADADADADAADASGAAHAADAASSPNESGTLHDAETFAALQNAGAPSGGSPAKPPIDEASVAAFLAAHPDFFYRHPDLLKTLNVALETEGAASLVTRKLRLLNQEIAAQKTAHETFLEVVKANAELEARVYTLTLSLVRAGDLEAVSEALFAALRDEFRADAVAVWLADPAESPLPALPPLLVGVPAEDARAKHLAQWIEAGPRCGRFAGSTLSELFTETSIGSAVLLPFPAGALRGLVAIGARDETRFAAGLGTETLQFLVAVAAARFERCLSAERSAASAAVGPTTNLSAPEAVAAAPVSDRGQSQRIGAAVPPATQDDGPG